jgi:hypothetical protein
MPQELPMHHVSNGRSAYSDLDGDFAPLVPRHRRFERNWGRVSQFQFTAFSA